ncbi:nitroreductase family protein [Kribbella sp. NBC_01505]|uniref:nitroreductase family protein n=1 Tax=Kribbella sp. NBC_01505 TaxID=2903580 RepID=UPI00386CE5E3
MTLTVAEAIRHRRTVRHYRPDPVPSGLLEELLMLAVEAPSSWNLQDRSVVVVSDRAGLDGLAGATGGQPQPREAPVMLVFVADANAWQADQSDIHRQARDNSAWSDEFSATFEVASVEFQQGLEAAGLLREYAVKDAMIAASFVMLAATSLGLATSPMNGWNEGQVKKVIGIDDREDLAIALLMSVGYAAEDRQHPGRRPQHQNVFYGRYQHRGSDLRSG